MAGADQSSAAHLHHPVWRMIMIEPQKAMFLYSRERIGRRGFMIVGDSDLRGADSNVAFDIVIIQCHNPAKQTGAAK